MRLRLFILTGSLAVGFVSLAAPAQETTGYQYDQLGRLVSTSISGGPNATKKTATCFDPAGNRVQYSVGTVMPPECTKPASRPATTPTPSPTPAP